MRFPVLAELDQHFARRQRVQRHDSPSAFLSNQLQHIRTRTYDRKYPFLDASEHVPTESDVNPGAMSWAYDSFEQRGEAEFLGAGAHDIPRADVSGRRHIFPVRTLVSSYGWNLEEMEAAEFAGTPLSQRKADAARRAIAEKEHETILNGRAPLGIPGFLTNAAVPIFVVPNGDWLNPATTADEMLQDLNAIYDFIFVRTRRVHRMTALSLPVAHFRRIQTARIGVDSGMTVLKFFNENTPGVEFKALNELATAGPASAPRGVGYEKLPENLGGIIPLAFDQLEPQMQGLEMLVPVRERIGGTVFYYPHSACYVDGM